MSFWSVRPGLSTSAEAALLTQLNNLSTTATGFHIVKNSNGTFSNVADTIRAVGSVLLFASDTSVSVLNGTAAISIPAQYNGLSVVDVTITVFAKGVTGTTTIQVRRRRAGVNANMLTSALAIGDAYFANTPTINASNSGVLTGDQLYVDVLSIHSGTAPLGMTVAVTLG